jgi:hypothetical protein
MMEMRLAGIFVQRKRLHVGTAICGPALKMLTRGPEGLVTLAVKLIVYLRKFNYAEMII